MRRSALFSDCRSYRYILFRVWRPENGAALFICLNPSSADEVRDDNTSKRCMSFADSWGFGAIMIANLFAFCATKPSVMKAADDPVGPNNDAALWVSALCARKVIAAWGTDGDFKNRASDVCRMLSDYGFPLHHLGLTKSGQPRHPLRLRADTEPTLWEVA